MIKSVVSGIVMLPYRRSSAKPYSARPAHSTLSQIVHSKRSTRGCNQRGVVKDRRRVNGLQEASRGASINFASASAASGSRFATKNTRLDGRDDHTSYRKTRRLLKVFPVSASHQHDARLRSVDGSKKGNAFALTIMPRHLARLGNLPA